MIRHTTAIGAHGATAVEVVYYSIYRHLRQLDKDVHALNGKIYRKDPLGLVGTIHGQTQRIHLEIIAGRNDAEVQMLCLPLRLGNTQREKDMKERRP